MAEKVTKVFTPKQIINKEEAQALEDLLKWQKEFQEEVKDDLSEIEKLRYKDITERLKGRQKFANFLMMLLVLSSISWKIDFFIPNITRIIVWERKIVKRVIFRNGVEKIH